MIQPGAWDTEGTSILETLWSLILLAFVIQGGWAVFAQHRAAAADVSARAEGLETIRTIAWLLPEEVEGGRPEADWWRTGHDSLPLRAFRGLGLVEIGSVERDRIRVCFRGIRSPNPEKDSVLLLEEDGEWRTYDLQQRSRTGEKCTGLGGGYKEDWSLSPEPNSAVVARIFERGVYYLADGALRYRRGGGGRQPLTPLRVETGALPALPGTGGGIIWEVLLTGNPARSDSSFWRGRVW